jgi:hypothetical protein
MADEQWESIGSPVKGIIRIKDNKKYLIKFKWRFNSQFDD